MIVSSPIKSRALKRMARARLGLSLGLGLGFGGKSGGGGGGGGGVALAANPAPAQPAFTYSGSPSVDSATATGNVGGYFDVLDNYQLYTFNRSGGGNFVVTMNSAGAANTGLTLTGLNDTFLGFNINGVAYGGNIPITSLTTGGTFTFGRERTTGDIVVTQNSTEVLRISSASIVTAAGATLANTKAAWNAASGGTISSLTVGPWYTTYAPLTIKSTLYNVDTHNFDVVIAYYTALIPTYEISRNGGAYQDIAAYATTGAGNATLRLPAADIGMNGRATYTLRQKNLTTSTGTGFYVIPEPMILGINVGLDALSDLGLTVGWQDPVSYNNGIGRLGDYTVSPNVGASTDGSGTTVKRDTFGKIYATNGAGLTNYRALNNATLCSSGLWNFAFAAGVVISDNIGLTGGGITTGYTYSSTTGLGSFTVPGGTTVAFNIIISAASIPVGGTGLSLIKQGVVGQFDANAVALIPTIAKEIRFLDAAYVNNPNYNNRTPLLMASRTFANRNRSVEWDIETQVAFANATGCGMVYQNKHIDDNTMVTGVADYIAANLVGQARFSLSNEIWNFIFQQTLDVRLMGVRLGMAPAGATPGTLVAEPNTYDGTQTGTALTQAPTWVRGDWSGSVFTENDYGGAYGKLLVALPINGQIMLNGAGLQVYNTATAQAINVIFNLTTGVAVSGGSGNFTVKYTSSDTNAAGLRWMSYRMKQIITIVNARFALASKPNPKYIVEGQAAGGFGALQPVLDWDNLYLLMAGSHASAGFYYGNGTAGDTLGEFTSTTYAEWTATTGKNALFDTATNPTLAARISAAKTAYFSASGKTVTATVSAAASFRNALITYNLGKSGGLANDIKMGEYEFNWHTIFNNWPDKGPISEYVSSNGYKSGSTVYSSGNGLFTAILDVPVTTPPPNASYWTLQTTATGTIINVATGLYKATQVAPNASPPPNATYWVSMASNADFTPLPPSDQLFSSIVLDSRHGTDIGNLINGLRNVHGGPSYFYALLGPNISSSNYFGLIQSYTDTTAANYRYSAVKAARTAIG